MTIPPTASSSVPPVTLDRAAIDALQRRVKVLADASGLFGVGIVSDGVLSFEALGAGGSASYRVFADAGRVWISLVTPDRYLSQSIEQDLVHTGDKIGDLLHDELIDVDHPAPYRPVVEHFRDPAKLFTFRSAIPAADLTAGATLDSPAVAERLWLTLKAYQACFVNLGGMNEGE
jgi:hypothetical protein